MQTERFEGSERETAAEECYVSSGFGIELLECV